MWTVLSSSHLLRPVGYLSGRWREMYLMSVYMFLLLYCFNSLGDHSGRSPMYHGFKMYSSALFPFIASVQYFLKVFWMSESWVWVSGGGWLVGWFLLGWKSSLEAECILFKCINVLSLCFSFLVFPVLSMDLWVKLGISLRGFFLMLAMQYLVALTVIWSCSLGLRSWHPLFLCVSLGALAS